jgi:UDP-N-acetylglucosamine diphosphorylase / glucose-1-phosphate thymidylyltransferase / UDP-N-acetylgalactosamine diphosphorylase / glucosamine-1-phosphate N-acetyltransferase / galactosamine-1-phosphate N-acetyltransferase
MSELSLVLFDDAVAQAWHPFTLTRPAGELLFGGYTFRARAERVLGMRCIAHLAADHLEGFDEPGSPRAYRLDEPAGAGDRLFLLSRAVPAWSAADQQLQHEHRSGPVEIGGELVGWLARAEDPAPPPEFLHNPEQGPPGSPDRAITLPGTVLRNVWELICGNPDQLADDIRSLHAGTEEPKLPPGVHKIGVGPLVLGHGVILEPGVVLDTSAGAIWLDDGAEVRAFTRLAGPAYIGAHSCVLGGRVEAVSIGPWCQVHGELAQSVCIGYSNKQHDGYLGHAYLGRWVNLGAGTTNSNLKNNYGTIRVWTPAGEVDTGEIKFGSLLGDHVKTGIGSLLNTGTVIGAGSNLFGAAMPPTYVPPFSWGSGGDLTEYRIDKFLEVAERVMARRNVELTPGLREVLRRASGSSEHARHG